MRGGGKGDPCFPNTKNEKEEEEKKPHKKNQTKTKKTPSPNTKTGKANETEIPNRILPSPAHGCGTYQFFALSGFTIATDRRCRLVITLGGEQRQQCKIGREGGGEAQGVPAINYSACRGRAAVAHRSQEEKPRSHGQLPHHPPHPRAAANAAARDHDGRARGREHDGGSLRLCGRTAPRAPRGALPRASSRPRPRASRRRRGRVLLPNPGRAGGPPACRPPGPLPARPSAAATHSHRGRHRVAQVFAPRLGETIPARVREAGQGQRDGSAGKSKTVVLILMTFCRDAHPTPRKMKGSSRIRALTLNRPCSPSLDGAGRGRGRALSRSPRAGRWRRRKRRRRGRCSRLGREPCQENTSSQPSPPIPAAARTGAGPPALLPPRSPHLGPIVWLGAPGGGRTGRRRERESGRGGERRSREGAGGGSPALRSVGESSPSKVISVQASAPSPPGPRRRRLAGQRVAESRVEDARPRRHSLVPRHRWLRKRRRPRRLPGPGRVAFEPRSQNKQLKMAATPLRHPPPSGTAPSALRLRAPRASPLAREQRGEAPGTRGASELPRREERGARGRVRRKALQIGVFAMKLLKAILPPPTGV